MTDSSDFLTKLRDALDEHDARIRAANEQASRNLRQLERIDTILEGGQIDQANGERERKLLNLVASYHRTHGNPLIAEHVRDTKQETMDALREFGPELRRLRESHGLRLGDLARVLGCKATALSDIELGLTGTAASRGPSTADWDALNHPPGPDDPKAHQRATWHLDRALAFIEAHGSWCYSLGLDFHGFLAQARSAAEKAERELADLQHTIFAVQGEPRVAENPEDLLTLGPKLRAMGPALRQLRLDHGVQISDLARATDANVPMLAAIELGLEPLWDRMLDARDMDRIRDLLHERRARLAARDGEACTWPELVRGLLDDLHTADLNAAHMEAKLGAAEAAATRLAELDAAWAKAGYTQPLTAESLKSVPMPGRYQPLD